jgi:small subunit ribosomal protein S8
MSISDPIADYLTIIRNGCKANFDYVDVPASKMKNHITQVLTDQGYIKKFIFIEDGKQGIIRIWLKYNDEGEPAIKKIVRVSRPGRKEYTGAKSMPRVRDNLGVAILTTPQGVMTAREASRRNVGGEILCYIW